MEMNSMFLCDFYKTGHPFQYIKGINRVYSNRTARKSRIPGIDKIVVFGNQFLCKEYLIDHFNRNFFGRSGGKVVDEYKRRIITSNGSHLPSYKHIGDLHDLGYLPVLIKSLPEGSLCPIRVADTTIDNTHDDFAWITNFLETLSSCITWMPTNSATLGYYFRLMLNKWAEKTGVPPEMVQWQGHDFSMRGMGGVEEAMLSGMGHLLSFTGTDTIPAIEAMERHYNIDAEKELIGGSVAATEHSVMCAGSKDGELETLKNLLFETYPNGIVSVVSDTWDLWKVLTDYLPKLKDKIMERDGKVVIRPDSGIPADIICGLNTPMHGANASYNKDKVLKPQDKGVIELLWDVFGGTINGKGYKMVDSHVGGIYGDAITAVTGNEICARLEAKGYASQMVFGLGSYFYHYNTRDTFGMAYKATAVEVNGELREIFKDPITDDGTKKSAKGLLRVEEKDGTFILHDQQTKEQEATGALVPVFKDGKMLVEYSLTDIRNRLWKQQS